MHRPVLVTPPTILPVSVAEVKPHLYEDTSDNDARIVDLIRTATDHLDGWSGVMGQCLVEQEWRQDFDRFRSCLHLPLGPVIRVTSVTVGGDALDPSAYSLKTDAGGRARVEIDRVSFSGAASVVYKAGHLTIPEVPADGDSPAIPERSSVPQDIKTAIIIYVKAHFDDQKPDAIASAMRAFDDLVSKRRRVGV